MKSHVNSLQTRVAPAQVRTLAALGIAAAVLIAWPGHSQAHEPQGHGFGGAVREHAGSFAGHGGYSGHAAYAGHAAYLGNGSYAGHAVRTGWHGGVGVGVHVGGPGYHGGVGWGGGGRWDHGWHGGHYGWWYIDAGVWTPYPYYPYGYYPYYAYPAPYPVPYGYVAEESAVANRNLPPAPASWYYCDAARAYYPYVQSCPSGWRQVAAQAAPPPAPAPASGAAPAAPITAPPQ